MRCSRLGEFDRANGFQATNPLRKEVDAMSKHDEVVLDRFDERETPEYAPPVLESLEAAAPLVDIICVTGH